MSVFTTQQVREHAKKGSCWVTFKGKVYDMTPFAQHHPGGEDLLLQFAGTDITTVLFEDTLHRHSETSIDLMEEYCMGSLLSDLETDTKAETETLVKEQQKQKQKQHLLDLRQPLFPQLWNATYSKDYYLEQVHKPRYVSHYVPYFSDPRLDVLSKTTWYTIPMIWIPFVLYQLWCSLCCGSDTDTEKTVFSYIAGVVAWTFLEYALHRFLFHIDYYLPDHPVALLLHFTLHGIHHYMPMDRLRLVMPPALTVLIGTPIIQLTHWLLAPRAAYAFVAGAFSGYIAYDMVHYYLHHAQVIKIYFKEMKRYHIAHHYKVFDLGFGITSKLWDHVFGTVLEVGYEEHN
ncbi:hypothetical protein BDF14DRAFT_1982104 [Spinellus fusiger]|nr:hypothetical protein BDF14DRAFT_1982104 [Spinellus fusiger]